MESPLPREGGVAPRSIHRDPEKRSVVLAEFRQDLVVEAHLIAADRAPVGRVERQDHRVTSQFRQRYFLIRRALQLEVGRRVAAAERPAMLLSSPHLLIALHPQLLLSRKCYGLTTVG